MEEIGIDLQAGVPKGFDALMDSSFDLIVSLTPEAQHNAVELTRTSATELEYWPCPDPTLVTGSREQILQAFRETRDFLRQKIQDLIEWQPPPSV